MSTTDRTEARQVEEDEGVVTEYFTVTDARIGITPDTITGRPILSLEFDFEIPVAGEWMPIRHRMMLDVNAVERWRLARQFRAARRGLRRTRKTWRPRLGAPLAAETVPTD